VQHLLEQANSHKQQQEQKRLQAKDSYTEPNNYLTSLEQQLEQH